jgi:hypothetical protein
MLILGVLFGLAALVGILVGLAHLHDATADKEGGQIKILVFVMWVIRDNPAVKLADDLANCFDKGSLKVFWATEQIIMSCSWNIDVGYPPPFSNLQKMLGVFSLDFLALECFQVSYKVSCN